MKRTLLATLAYTIGTFTLAVLWHVVLLEETYTGLGYFEGEPDFLLGLLAIVIQGAVLSALFPRVRLAGSSLTRGMKFAGIIGVFFWTSHVLAFLAKQQTDGAVLFLAMESFYLVLQFGLFGWFLGLIFRDSAP